ncbi:MAG TPA: hypothetical protein VFE62_19785 [Gemmataceae bacterium]|nr:hypothetical protein [Gemmataceae bacterium]
MPRKAGTSIPKYRRHKASGQAVVTIAGRDHYLGPHGGKTSVREYDRLVGEWLAGGRVLVAQVERHGMTIAELCRAYKAFAERYYRKEGRPTPTVDSIRVSLRTLRQMYGDTPAADFGPLALAAVRQRFIDKGACRRYARSAPCAHRPPRPSLRATPSSIDRLKSRLDFMVDEMSSAASWQTAQDVRPAEHSQPFARQSSLK